MGVRRLGRTSAFIGKVGGDDFGRGLRRTLDAERVDTRGLIDDPEALTTLALVSHNTKGDPAFAFFEGAHLNLTPADLDADLIRRAHIFHFGSVTLTRPPASTATLEALKIAKSARVITSFDINWRPAVWHGKGIEAAAAPLQEVDVIKMNEGELTLVTGIDEPRVALRRLDVPARLVLITLGEKGCLFRLKGEVGIANAPQVREVIDATGAGDAFTAAILAGLPSNLDALSMDSLKALATRACRAGALTTTRRGAIPALPTIAELGE